MFIRTLDFTSGYWQTEMEEGNCTKTAFVMKHGLYEHTRMGFSLCNPPSTFQRSKELVLQGLTWKEVVEYIDYVIIFGMDFSHHITIFREILELFWQHHG